MSENLMNQEHKASNKASREGWDRTFNHSLPDQCKWCEKYSKVIGKCMEKKLCTITFTWDDPIRFPASVFERSPEDDPKENR